MPPDARFARFTPFLSEGRRGQLDLGLHGCSDCRVSGFAGRDVFLDVRRTPLEDEGPVTAYLMLEDAGVMQALRGIVRTGPAPGTAVLHLTDEFVGQRRMFSRAPLALRAKLRGLAEGAQEWDTFTRDLSAGGLRVARRPEWDGAEAVQVTLLPAPDVRLVLEAEVVRVDDDGLGLRFTRIEPAERALLAELTIAYHRSD